MLRMLRSLGESGLLTVLGKVASIVRVERMGEEAGDTILPGSLWEYLRIRVCVYLY